MDAGLPVRAFFTDRYEGVSSEPFAQLNLAEHVGDNADAVAVNRAIVQDRAGGAVVFMRPLHGAQVVVLGGEYLDGRDPPEADALITTVPGLGLAVLAADCVPLLIHDGVSGAVAAVHIGREGLRQGVIDAAMTVLIDIRGGERAQESMTASIGPAICGRCYEVPAKMRADVATLHPLAATTTSWGSPALDLPLAVAERLAHLGMTHVVRHRSCTFEDLRLFSYRRDRVTGRQAGVVVCDAPQY